MHRLTVHLRVLLCVACVTLNAGCATTSPFTRERLVDELAARTKHTLPLANRKPVVPGQSDTWNLVPPGVRLDDGLTEDEAVAIGLWNNPAFLADLSTLDMSRADLVTAGMIRNPIFSLLLPLGPKQLEFTALIPIEELWQRPRRVSAAQGEVERVATSLVQTGLDLVRETRFAFAELLLAQRRETISLQLLTVRREIARIASSRLSSGDISQMEQRVTSLEVLAAEAEQVQLARATAQAKEMLWLRLGFGQAHFELGVVAELPAQRSPQSLADALRKAKALRPDLRGAELAVEVAASRLGLEKTRIVSAVAAVVDANGQGLQGFEMGPGLSLELPIFNQNQGGIARADAELQRAAWRYLAVRQQVEGEVRAALLDCDAAQAALEILSGTVLADAQENTSRVRRAFSAGDVSYLAVLDASRQLLEVLMREANLQAMVRRSTAQLERSVGGHHAKD